MAANQNLIIGACTFHVSAAAGAIQLFPAGKFDAPNGALMGKGPWFTSAEIAARLFKRVAARKNDILIDYEHQTLLKEKNGQPAPAAGWVKSNSLEWRDDGIFAANPNWTERAAAHIDNDEFKYISPVFTYNPKTGEIVDLLHIAISNFVAIDGMQELQAAASAKFNLSNQPQEENSMNELLKLFGLEPDASEDDVVAAATALIQTNADLTTQLAEKDEAIAAASAATPVEAVQAMKELQGEVAALTSKIEGNELEDLVTAALSDGRLVPAQEKWARKQSVAALSAFLEDAPKIAALSGPQTNDKDLDQKSDTNLSETELAVCGQTGVSPEDYLKTKEAQ